MEMYEKKIKRWTGFLKKLYNKSLLKSFPRYQPIWQEGELISGSDRNCSDRWQLINEQIKKNNVKNLLDLGSAEGFYVLQSAKQNVFSLGIDADERRISVAQMQLVNEKILNAGFMYAIIDKELIEKMPRFDCIIFMSVAHHMMASKGKDYTLEILSRLREKTKKCIIFEMGQSDEKNMKWTNKLPNMGNDPHKWITDFLKEAGFEKVEKIGESLSYNGEIRRAIFKATP